MVNKNVFLRAVMLASALGTAATAEAKNLAVTAGLGGLGVDWTVPVAERLQTRFHLSHLSYNIDGKANNDPGDPEINYDIQLNNSQAGVLLDWHPFAGGFRLTGGLVVSDLGVDLATGAQDEYEVGDETYKGDLSLAGNIGFNPVTPYLSFGWASAPTEMGLSFVSEFGLMLIGEGTIDLDATGKVVKVGTSLEIDPATNAEFQQELEKERQNVLDDLAALTVFPVFSIGVAYAF